MISTHLKIGHLTDTLLKEVARAGANGINTSELTGYTVKQADAACGRLVSLGRLFKGKIGHRTCRYFSTPAFAMAYEDSNRIEPASVRLRASRALWKPDPKGVVTPVQGITAATKITVWQPPPPRFIRTDTYNP